MLRTFRAALVAVATVATLTAVPAPAPAAAAAAAKQPVIVVNGLIGISVAYEPLAARLRADGYPTYIYELPNLGTGDIAASAQGLAAFVRQVRAGSGSATVTLLGHSEGGLVSRYYLKFLGGTDSVHRYISLGTPQYGTYVANLVAFFSLGSCVGIVACQQMTIGSDFLNRLNSGDDTPGSVSYATIRTLQDELVRPVGNAAVQDGATNVLLQGLCPLRVTGHLGLIFDGAVYSIVRNLLAGGPARASCFAL